VPVLARKPGALRNGAPFKDWVLPAAMERVRRKLASFDDGNRQMVDILTVVLTDGLPAVEAACAEAIAHGGHQAEHALRSDQDARAAELPDATSNAPLVHSLADRGDQRDPGAPCRVRHRGAGRT
jgi:hypothetical protein